MVLCRLFLADDAGLEVDDSLSAAFRIGWIGTDSEKSVACYGPLDGFGVLSAGAGTKTTASEDFEWRVYSLVPWIELDQGRTVLLVTVRERTTSMNHVCISLPLISPAPTRSDWWPR